MHPLKLSDRILDLRVLLALTACLLVPGLAWADEGEDDEGGAEEGEDDAELPPWADGDEGEEGEGDDEGDSTGHGDAAGDEGEGHADSGGGEADEAAGDGAWKGGGLFGLGFGVGTSNGLSVKIWPAEMHGIVISLGAPLRLNSLSFGLSYRIHPKGISVPGSRLHLNPNLGPAFRMRMFVYSDGTYLDGLGGLAVGLSATISGVPAEFFVDVIPGVTFGINIPGTGLGFDVGGQVGARVYF